MVMKRDEQPPVESVLNTVSALDQNAQVGMLDLVDLFILKF